MSQNQTLLKIEGLCYNVDPSGYYFGHRLCEFSELPRKTIILLDSIMPGCKHIVAYTKRISAEAAKALLQRAGEVISYIGFNSFTKALEELAGKKFIYASGTYCPNDGDVAIAALMKPWQTMQQQVSIDEVEFYLIHYVAPV
ncbi:hypothetical protein Pogu_2112 [Pyrobaculum oguniense TE7]|uniref:Uncharacterized protein n=1 Tax=Pyrobaculum oguniense (strain DSM 13380 / JCM 10595 / TE7) TaxID=698757 RepID=H6QCU3_PYROT|nr:hypothetical protein Pogu_2112 [Pyrobaculum oguniense TE7]